jgi:UDP-N-acetylglucosamine 3-dehydrogenase
LRKFMAECDLGKLLHVSSTRLGPYTGRIRDVGVTLDLASHDLDLATWLSRGEFTSISGNLKSKYNTEFEDICLIRGSLSGGAVYSGEISWVHPFKVRKTRLLFEGGLLEADTLTGDAALYHIVDWEESTSSPSVFIEPKSSSMVRGSIDKVEPLLLEHLEFRRFLEDGNPGELCTVDDAFKVMRAAEVVLEKQS